VKVSEQYYWDILLSQQMLDDIKRVTDDSFVFQQDSTPAHCAHSPVQLLQFKILDFLSPELHPTKQPTVEPP